MLKERIEDLTRVTQTRDIKEEKVSGFFFKSKAALNEVHQLQF